MKVTGQNINRTIGNTETAKTDKLGGKSADLSRTDTAATSNTPAAATASKVNLSSRAQAMAKAKEIASDQSIDEAKVARLQKMIDAGEYKTDAKAIADRMVDEHMLFPE